MHVQDEVGAPVDPPRHALGLLVGKRAGLPEEEVAVGVEALRLGRDLHAREAHVGVGRVAFTGLPRAVDEQVRVVTDLAVTHPDLHRPHVARARHRSGEDEVVEHVGSVGPKEIGLRRREHEIGWAELPALGEARRRRSGLEVTLGGSRFEPALDEGDLGVGEAPCALEDVLARLGQPRGHVPARRHLADLLGVRAHVAVAEKAERSRFARAVTDRAVLEDDGGDVPVERHLVGRDDPAQGEHCGGERGASHGFGAMEQPTAGVSLRATAWPASTAVRASSRSCTVGLALMCPRSW